ncbi:uncharacterized protein YjaZ [Variovorax boronicumulans]|uniref:DUF2268 domain-containing putative Zn-dependent protease n=1 Tax=Variovorax boronicumulans TaxID=436515 RepID=UPI0024758626|nr:DUF2268 domain-containing putative Zn-dependent protease [Variovorax boronicumulans]MDH6170914.1 uncharacterized protein YjaZ [Variovorax boronicumulans]
MSITFHFPDAGEQLNPWLPRVRELLTSTMSEITHRLPLDRLDVVTYASDAVIPELGVNGFAEGRHLLHLKLDPANPNFASKMDTAIPSLFAHEAHHCMREASVGYGSTLRAALVSEGLACHFESEVTGRIPFYGTALTSEQVFAMEERMRPLLDMPWYNHSAWFFGNPREEIPRHCGYSVGFSLVGEYLKRSSSKASVAVGRPAEAFFE